MAEETVDEVRPWEFWVVDLLPVSAPAAGALIGLGMLGLFVGLQLAFGFPFGTDESAISEVTRDSFFVSLLTGYTFTAFRLGAAGIQRDMGRAGVEELFEIGAFPRNVVRASRFWGCVGVLLGVVAVTAIARAQGLEMRAPWSELHESSFLIWALLLVFWQIGRAVVFTIQGSRFAASVTAEEMEVDLLDLGSLDAFGRIGLRFALLWIVGVTLAAPLLLGGGLAIVPLLVALAVTGGVAALAFLIPVIGVHARIRATKEDELRHVAAAIAGDESAWARTRIAKRREVPTLADWIAYRGLVESISEWPYDAPTLSRFVLYLGIPLASWVAAALVERSIDALF